MRSVWVQQINAASRLYGLKYSDFIHGLASANIMIDRKVLSQLAMFEPFSFRALTKAVQQHGAVEPSYDVRSIVSKKPMHDQT